MEVKIFTDGSARGNPGPGGYGAIIQYIDKNGQLHEKELSQGFAHTTNNQMELMGAIAGLEILNRPCKVILYSDSNYLVRAFNDKWIDSWLANDFRRGRSNEVKNIELWERLIKVVKKHEVTFVWVKGHAGHPENERCDELATNAADQAAKQL